MKKLFPFAFLLVLLAGCRRTSVPEHYSPIQVPPTIYPDYSDVTVPVNIAPLRFELLVGADEAVTRYAAGDEEIICAGIKARPDVDDWKSLMAKASGGSVDVEIYARKGERWVRFRPFQIHVSPDSIDPWLSYRLISPSYVAYEELTINQRCLENFDEQVIVDNMLCSTESGGQCVNCHNYQSYNPRRMQFHARETDGGTVVVYDDRIFKVDLNTDSTLAAGAYPSWHPQLPLIAYSTNKTMQAFHTSALDKIEVLDAASDLILYDIERQELTTVSPEIDELEIFPSWSPDGRYLYFCSAHFRYNPYVTDSASQKVLLSTSTPEQEIIMRAGELKYNIYRLPFDPITRQFGERELVYDAASVGRSATLPRLSPDGRRLMFTVGDHGCFHIWHHDADLWMLDLKTGQAEPMTILNSDEAESYHSWSSNGRWVVFSSRRGDGVFTRPFIAHVDANGKASRPFELPAADPDYHRQLMKSYNVPELMSGPVMQRPQDMARTLKTKAQQVRYVPALRPATPLNKSNKK